MARPKKTSISGEVGQIPVTRKRGNPDFSVSSFYIPKKLNLKFDRAILTLKAADFDVDRSDVLAGLINRFVQQVDVAEQEMEEDGGLDLNAVLDAAGSGSVVESAGMTLLKDQLKRTLVEAKETVDELKAIHQRRVALHQEQISCLLALIPEDSRVRVQEQLMDDPDWKDDREE